MTLEPRLAQPGDADAMTATITTAFHNDPLWSWVFFDEAQRPGQFMVWWRLFVDAALRNEWTWVTPGCEAVALWVPPGRPELGPDEEARLPSLLKEFVGAHARTAMEVLLQFEAMHPRDEPHYYLSIVATHSEHRGRGIGVALLAQNLARIDAEHLPAYLESSNPANLERYQRLGFEPIGEIFVAPDRPVVTTMWRPAR